MWSVLEETEHYLSCSVCPAIWLIELDKLDTRLALQVNICKYRFCDATLETTQEAREAALLNNQTTIAPTTTMMMTTSNPDFGLDLLSQNDSFNKSLDIDLSVLNDIGVDLSCSCMNQTTAEKFFFLR